MQSPHDSFGSCALFFVLDFIPLFTEATQLLALLISVLKHSLLVLSSTAVKIVL